MSGPGRLSLNVECGRPRALSTPIQESTDVQKKNRLTTRKCGSRLGDYPMCAADTPLSFFNSPRMPAMGRIPVLRLRSTEPEQTWRLHKTFNIFKPAKRFVNTFLVALACPIFAGKMRGSALLESKQLTLLT